MADSTAVLSPTASKFLKDLDLYLKSDEVVSLTIETPQQCEAAIALANMVLHVKKNELEGLRKKEAKPFDEGKAAVQAHFNPRKAHVEQRQGIIMASVSTFRKKQRLEIEAACREADAEADTERKALESSVESASARAHQFIEEANALIDLASKSTDEKEKAVYTAKANSKRRWAEDWLRKAENKSAQAAAVVPPPIPAAAPVKTTGLKVTMEASEVTVTDWKALLEWIISRQDYHYIMLMEVPMKKYLKNNNGEKQIPGLSYKWDEKLGVTGRY